VIINFIFPQTPNSSAAGVEAVEAWGLAFFEKGKKDDDSIWTLSHWQRSAKV
jgi:hypothetical protein